MKVQISWFIAGCFLLPPAILRGGETEGQSTQAASESAAASTEKQAEEEIRKAAAEFARAFEAGDAKTVAASFTKKGEYTDDQGVELRGREEIEKAYAEHFKNSPKARMKLKIDSIHFPSPEVAIEEGFVMVETSGPELPSTSRYVAMHVKEDGQWKTANIREWNPARHALAELEWLVGDWQAKSDGESIHLSFQPNDKKTFLVCKFRVEQDGKTVSSGTQMIGEDPESGRLRSWTFYDEGGHSQSLWIHDGNRWMLDTIGVFADGERMLAMNLLSRVNPNEFTWQSIERVVGNQVLPDGKPMKVTRGDGAAAAKQ